MYYIYYNVKTMSDSSRPSDCGDPATCARRSPALSIPSRSTSKKLKASRTASGQALAATA